MTAVLALIVTLAADSIAFRAADERLWCGDVCAQHAQALTPKEFTRLEGSAHGQQMLLTPGFAALRRHIIRFLQNGRP